MSVRTSLARTARAAALRSLAHWSVGRLTVSLPDGEQRSFGPEDGTPHARLTVHSDEFFLRFALRGDMGVGEAYTDGLWSSDDLPAFLALALRNADHLVLDSWLTKLLNLGKDIAHRLRPNTRRGSRKNVEAHYDLSNDFFALFLDETMTYSSAVFASEDEPLAQAQRRKYEAMARLAHLRPGDHVLEIGCGWGGFALHAAREVGCRVTGLTLSPSQYGFARERVRAAGLEDRIDIRLQDYRDLTGTFDRVVSIEMFEALGYENWGTFFSTVDRVLAPDGVLALQSITIPDHRFREYLRHADWLQTYIFPGGVLGSVSHMAAAAAGVSPLVVHELADIGIHYARTLALWRQRFRAQHSRVIALGFDERFIRLWDYYLAVSEAAFATRTLSDVQMAFTRPMNGSLPGIASRRVVGAFQREQAHGSSSSIPSARSA